MPKNAPSRPSSSSSSEDNANPGIVEDDLLANAVAQLSISGAADSETAPQRSQPAQTSHACAFDIQSDSLEYRGELLKNVQYRLRSKRALNTKARCLGFINMEQIYRPRVTRNFGSVSAVT
jgi:hypothetical protein